MGKASELSRSDPESADAVDQIFSWSLKPCDTIVRSPPTHLPQPHLSDSPTDLEMADNKTPDLKKQLKIKSGVVKR